MGTTPKTAKKSRSRTVQKAVQRSEYGSDEEATDEGSDGFAVVRKGRVEFSRAVSLTPYAGDFAFNVKLKNPDDKGGKDEPSESKGKHRPYQPECHATQYQFGVTITPGKLAVPSRSHKFLTALAQLSGVGGNQSNWMTDYSPHSLIVRVTDQIPHGMLNAFELDKKGKVCCPSLVRAVEVGDIDPKELIVGGEIADTPNGTALKATCYPGIKTTVAAVLERLIKKGIKP